MKIEREQSHSEMKPKWKRFTFVLCLAIGGIWFWAINYPLLLFSWKIAGTDRVEFRFPGGSGSIALPNEQVASLVSAVSAATRDFGAYKCKFDSQVLFLRGSNCLGAIDFCGNLILVEGKQYRESSGEFKAMVMGPRTNWIIQLPKQQSEEAKLK